jgi:hypothetical protein
VENVPPRSGIIVWPRHGQLLITFQMTWEAYIICIKIGIAIP